MGHDTSQIGLYKGYKNGKAYIRPTLFIDSDFENYPGRPWYCNERRYKYLSKATAALLELAKKQAPVKTK